MKKNLHQQQRRKNRRHFGIALFLFAVSLILGVVVARQQLLPFLSLRTPAISDEQYATTIVAACAGREYRPACYDEEIPKLMKVMSMERAFAVTQHVIQKDPSYAYCHVLGHKLSAAETKKDPSKWKTVVSRCPSGMCSNGCIHGAFQEKFRAEALPDAQIQELKPELNDICESRANWKPTNMEQAQCYHALGHLTMYVTGANIEKSVHLCEEIAKKSDGRDFRDLCFDGVFMQIFQPLEPEDIALVAGKQPKKEGVAEFCSRYPNNTYSSCWTESWPLSEKEILTPAGLYAFCAAPKDTNARNRCFTGLFYVVTPRLDFDVEKITAFCKDIPADRRGQCFANGASRMIETDWSMIDRSLALCERARENQAEKTCYDELLLYASYNFHAASKEQQSLCDKLPQPWKQQCGKK